MNFVQSVDHCCHHPASSSSPPAHRHHDCVAIVRIVVVVLDIEVIDIVIVGIVVIVVVVIVVIHIGHNVGGHTAGCQHKVQEGEGTEELRIIVEKYCKTRVNHYELSSYFLKFTSYSGKGNT